MEQQRASIREEVREAICHHLQIKNQYTMILNNTTRCSLEQLVVIAQVLSVKVDELVLLEEVEPLEKAAA